MSNETAIVKCGTSKGDFTMELHRSWSPIGYDRAVELFDRGFYDGSHFYRVVPKFLVQFGISYTLDVDLKHFARTPIPDDPKHDPVIPFEEGTISYAGSGDNSRTSHLFISYGSSKSLGTQEWETPVGTVIEGMESIRNLYSYGDMPPWGKGPVQGKIHSGRSYIEENFPLIDKFLSCTVKRISDGEDEGGSTDLNEEENGSEEDWSSTAVKREKLPAIGLKEKLKTKFQTLRAQVHEPTGDNDLIRMAAVLAVILIAFMFKLAIRPKKAPSKSS